MYEITEIPAGPYLNIYVRNVTRGYGSGGAWGRREDALLWIESDRSRRAHEARRLDLQEAFGAFAR